MWKVTRNCILTNTSYFGKMEKHNTCAQSNLMENSYPSSTGTVTMGIITTIAVIYTLVQSMGYIGSTYPVDPIITFNLSNTVVDSRGILPNQGPITDLVREEYINLLKIKENRNASVNFANFVIDRMERLEENLVKAEILPVSGSPAHHDLIHHYPIDDAIEKGLQALTAIIATVQLSHQCGRLNNVECAQFLSAIRLKGTALGISCAQDQKFDCDMESSYRSIDGSCNNLQKPKWGSSLTAYSRLLFPSYADGIHRSWNDVGVHALPNPRIISTAFSSQPLRYDNRKTLAVMQWSEFISNDIAYTPVRKMVWTGQPISCCTADGRRPAPRYIHPACDAISVPDNDPFYGKHRVRCLNYVRSLPVLKSDCSFGPAQQMNQVTHFLDGSTIYGSTFVKVSQIRKFEGGLLRVNEQGTREFLPVAQTGPASLCHSKECYIAGDDRASSEPHLAVMHTIWLREHNRIAKKLAEINPYWRDETLFQEARQIVTAEIQHITYKEWLPILLGKKYARVVGLTNDSSSVPYNVNSDPAVSNEVATAALRFLNSLKHGKLSLFDESRHFNDSLELSEHFYKPRIIEEADVFDGLIRGLTTQPLSAMDLHFIPEITHQLYKTNGDYGLDQISIDIQRGRDHGLPGYNEYRRLCGLPVAKSFEDFLPEIPVEFVKILRELYRHPDDVDLVIGGMAEKSADDAIIGPTFRYLIGEQFRRSRSTDRFFYDSSSHPHRFSKNQLNAIKKVTLARILCDNGDNITKIQPEAFLEPHHGNIIQYCTDFEQIPSVDLFAWAERAKAYR